MRRPCEGECVPHDCLHACMRWGEGSGGHIGATSIPRTLLLVPHVPYIVLIMPQHCTLLLSCTACISLTAVTQQGTPHGARHSTRHCSGTLCACQRAPYDASQHQHQHHHRRRKHWHGLKHLPRALHTERKHGAVHMGAEQRRAIRMGAEQCRAMHVGAEQCTWVQSMAWERTPQ